MYPPKYSNLERFSKIVADISYPKGTTVHPYRGIYYWTQRFLPAGSQRGDAPSPEKREFWGISVERNAVFLLNEVVIYQQTKQRYLCFKESKRLIVFRRQIHMDVWEFI
jgi:hypothetical protein